MIPNVWICDVILASKRPKAMIESSDSSNSDEEPRTARKLKKTEKDTNKNFLKLKEKFPTQWPDYKLRSWATMVVCKNMESSL